MKIFFSHIILPLLTTITIMDTYSYLIRSSSDYRQHLRRKSTRQRRRCLSVAKHQKTRFYIVRRCVIMLMCWNDKYD
ncbi:hypothetical protein QVD17_29659 [Tagetes erecta]|uniref:Uncharacterized protein n=1 Tax=Tagetes erecta TaxID=13708 RepID=A0AAD8K442_TARER|nr:hypothetical protein QVD17_29659 [Tagetes erecta]